VFRGRYKAVDSVAVKRLNGASSRDQAAALAQEVSAHFKARHPNIVHLFGACDDVDNLMIITEHMAGGDLASALCASADVVGWNARGKTLALQVATALNYLHALEPPILHLDVKPTNVLLTADLATAKLADLGLARANMQSRVSVHGCTPAYAAPEVMMRRRVNEKADIFSFGIVVYELVTLRPVPMGELSLPSSTPSAARSLFERCTREGSDQRPSATEVCLYLKQQAVGAPGAAAVHAQARASPQPRLADVGMGGAQPPQPVGRPAPSPPPSLPAAAVRSPRAAGAQPLQSLCVQQARWLLELLAVPELGARAERARLTGADLARATDASLSELGVAAPMERSRLLAQLAELEQRGVRAGALLPTGSALSNAALPALAELLYAASEPGPLRSDARACDALQKVKDHARVLGRRPVCQLRRARCGRCRNARACRGACRAVAGVPSAAHHHSGRGCAMRCLRSGGYRRRRARCGRCRNARACRGG
jgi:hypothetical protein